MNYPNNNAIDIDALMIALTQQTAPLPPDLQHQLTQTTELFRANPNEGGQTLRNLIRQSPTLENAYLKTLQDWDGEYSAQQRAKALSATFNTTQGFGFIFSHDILPTRDWVQSAQQIKSRSHPENPDWIRRGNTIVTMIAGGAFLGVLIAQIPGAIVGAIVAGIFGWYSSKSKTA